MAAKILLARSRSRLRDFFTAAKQMGVAVPGGADIACTAARAAFTKSRTSVKLDFANAFNTVYRGAVFEAVAELLPEWLPFVTAAYAEDSWLFFGPRCLPSAGGVQQGDVLGPALFSLVLALRFAPVAASF